MQALKITAHMLDGRVATTDGYLPLDGLLAWAWMMENHPELMAGDAGKDGELIEAHLPLEKRKENGEWYWACSFACFEPHKESRRYWHKRFDQGLGEQYIDFGKRRGSVNVKRATYKNYRMPLIYILVPKIEWYAVGEKEEIEKMLGRVTHIGKKASQGMGKIRRWTVEEWPEDLSHLRPIPVLNGDDYIGIRPPYWYKENMAMVRWPDDERLGARKVFTAQQTGEF